MIRRLLLLLLVTILVSLVWFTAVGWSPDWGLWYRFGLPVAMFVIGMLVARLFFQRMATTTIGAGKGAGPIAAAPEAAGPSGQSGSGTETVEDTKTQPRHTLPPHSQFRGRETELRELCELHSSLRAKFSDSSQAPLLGRPLILLIHGKAGIGKTAMAQRLAHLLMQQDEYSVLYANLGYAGDAASSGAALRQFIGALGWRDEMPDDGPERVSLFRRLTENRKVLVLLDAVRGKGQIAELLPQNANCTVIITSRRDLGPEFGFRSFQLNVLNDDDAVAMLYAAADKFEPSFPLPASTITNVCGGLPRALNIAGNWVLRDDSDFDNVATWLDPSRPRDEGGLLNRLRGHGEDVQEGFAVEYGDLDPALKLTLCLASLITTISFTPQTIADLLDCDLAEAQTRCSALKAAQFFDSAEPGLDNQPAYALHTLVKLFAAARLITEFPEVGSEARSRLDRAMGRHVQDVLHCVDNPLFDSPGRSSAVMAAKNPYGWLRRNLAEVKRGIEFTLDQNDPAALRRVLAMAPGLFCQSCGFVEVNRLLGEAMNGPDCDPITMADLLTAQGAALVAIENYVLANFCLDKANSTLVRAGAKQLPDEVVYRLSCISKAKAQAYAQMRSPTIAARYFHEARTWLSRLSGARVAYEQRLISLLEYLSHGLNAPNPEYPPEEFHEPDRFWVYLERHEEYRFRTEWAESLDSLNEAKACCMGDLRKEANVLYRRARLLLEQSDATDGDPRSNFANMAVRRSADAVQVFRQMENKVGEVRGLCLLVRCLSAANEINEASIQLDKAVAMFSDDLAEVAGDAMKPLEARLAAAAGELASAQRNPRRATGEFLKAANLFDMIGDGRNRNRYRNR